MSDTTRTPLTDADRLGGWYEGGVWVAPEALVAGLIRRAAAAARADERERLADVRRFAEVRAITARALGEDQRPWLDLLILLDHAALTQPADSEAAS